MKPRQTRIAVAALFALLIAGVFWSQSRIPALNEKAQMGLRTNFGDIAFEVALPVVATQSLPERVFRSAVNWGYTNLRGMAFGLLFAAAILTILVNLRSRQFKQPWMNTLSGIFLGAPLGVCVNCATPIALGLVSAGARMETALASLVASPTLNAIVLTMAFTLLPWELAAVKLLGVFIVLLLIPALVRRFAPDADFAAAGTVAAGSVARLPPVVDATEIPAEETIAASISQTLYQFVRSLWYLLRFAVPLMIVAGFLGALVIELVPFEWFANTPAGPLAILGAAVVAVLLPVPIAFDIIIVMALLGSGVATGLAAALLFGLGIYSVYPAAVLARYVSMKLSVALAVTVTLIAMLIGLGTDAWFERKTASERTIIASALQNQAHADYGRAISVCNELPATLHGQCLTSVVDEIGPSRSVDYYCRVRPASIGLAECEDIVRSRQLTADASSTASTAPCDGIADRSLRSRCEISAVLKMAQNSHDIDQCANLAEPGAVLTCRTEYINASLLFNPDSSACTSLPDDERSLCHTNADIYRHADTGNFAGCETLDEPGAREHCQYAVASNMIGRYRDESACARIQSSALAARCRSLVDAWRAEDERSFNRCGRLSLPELRNLCLVRVAKIRIASELSSSLLVDGLPIPRETLAKKAFNGVTREHAAAPVLAWRAIHESDSTFVEQTDYPTNKTITSGRFRTLDAETLGITDTWKFSPLDFFEPFIVGKGVASGDFNDDGWPDVVFATETGIRLYRNTGGQFALVNLRQSNLRRENVFLVAIVDADGDGRKDIFASTYGGTNYLLYNRDGEFGTSEIQPLKGSRRLTLSAGFGDLDRNGSVDIVLGNWSSGIEKLFVPTQSQNEVLLREGQSYSRLSLGEVRGETNSVLIAHLDNDRYPDVFVGNDRLVPDFIFFGTGDKRFSPRPASTDSIPRTTMFTMSVEAADFNNDLRPDIFSTDMTFSRSSRDDYCAPIGNDDQRRRCEEILELYARFRESSAGSCDDIADATDRSHCFSAFAVRAASQLGDTRYCEILPPHSSALKSLCDYLAVPAEPEVALDLDRFIEQVQRNTLLISDEHGFTERALEFGVDSSYWSWNAKAADLDNDGWQDIYVGNGFHFGDNFYEIQENVLFRNLQGERFEQVQTDWGLADPLNTPSYTYIDYDLDGDLDIIATGVLAAPRVFRNEVAEGNSITFQLVDPTGNTAAIGARMTIRYGDTNNAMAQRKEVKLSGGFLSFDHPALHFGTGPHTEILSATVHWPDGQETNLDGPLATGGIYRVTRLVADHPRQRVFSRPTEAD